MHTALCKLAYSGLAGRRRDTRMMLCVLAAAFALMTAMLCYAASGTRAQDETRKSIYGSWQIARYALDDEQAEQFVQSTAPTAVGKAQQYASLVNAQGLAFGALGTADERYFACGRLELLSGHLPQTSHEIALTTSVLDSLGASYELGQEIELLAKNGESDAVALRYTLCGVLPSYDAYWAVDNNLPVDAVLADADSLPAAWQPTVQLLCCYAEGETPVVPYVDGAQDPTWVQNTYAYPTQAEGDTGLAVFVGICAVLTLCAVFGLCSIQLRRRQQGLVTLRMIGAAKGMILRLCLWETVLLLAVSLPLGAVLGAALCVAGLAVQGNLEYFSVPAGQLCAGLALCAMAILAGMLLPAVQQAGQTQTHLPQKRVRPQRRVRILSPLPLRVVALNAVGLVLALSCVFLTAWSLLPYQRKADTAAVQIQSVREALTSGLAQDLDSLPDVQDVAVRTELPFQSGLVSEVFAQRGYWQLYMGQSRGVSAFRMWDEATVETKVYALPESTLRQLAAECGGEVDMDALLSGESVLLYSQSFVLDETGVTQWAEGTADFTGQQMTLRYPALTSDEDLTKGLTIGGCFAELPDDLLALSGAIVSPYAVFCSETLGQQLWADEVGEAYGYTAINVRLDQDAAYATQKSIAALVTRRGGVLKSNDYETAQRLWQEGSSAAFLCATAGVLGAALAVFLLWNLFYIYWQQQRRRIGILQAEGTARRMFLRSGLRQTVAAGACSLVIGHAAVALLWAITTARLMTTRAGGTHVLTSLPMRGSEYPWALHLAVCAGYLVLMLWLQLRPLSLAVRCSPVQNMKEET